MTGENGGLVSRRKESDVYDRQIRLWGAESQAKMSNAKVLYLHLTGVTSEIIKNLVLAGIRAVLCDDRPYPAAVVDTPSIFLSGSDRATASVSAEPKETDGAEPLNKKIKTTGGSVAEAAKLLIEELNPLLGDCEIVSKDALTTEYLAQFSVIIVSRCSMTEALEVSAKAPPTTFFYMTDTFGMYGACVCDLGPNCKYRPEQGKKLLDPTVLSPHVPLSQIFQVPLHCAVNRFYKKAPPATWIRYRCLLEYVERNNNKTWSSDCSAAPQDMAADMVSWLQQTSPTLLAADGGGEGVIMVEALQELARCATSEVAPICSVLGGLIGNEVIKVISGKGEPANNTILLDGNTCKALTFLVQPKA